jgi:hypothetical protein
MRRAVCLGLALAPAVTGCNCGGEDVVAPGAPHLCVHASADAACDPDGSELDWTTGDGGTPPAGALTTLPLTVMNDAASGAPLVIERIGFSDALGSARLFDARLCMPSCDVAELGFPASLPPGSRAVLELTLDATTLDGLVPAESLEIVSNTSGDDVAPVGTYLRPFTGELSGCLPNRFDANGDKGDGCECTPTAGGIERCDGIDNDCDGALDEDVEGSGIVCQTGLDGVCADGVTACVAATFTCQALAASSETCDGQDNDCDGAVDEENTWVPFNEGLSGGNMAAVDHDPRWPGVAYAITGNKVYRSDDGGQTFALAGEAPHGLEALAFPADDDTVILGASHSGLLRSEDDGATWSEVSLAGMSLVSILAHPADPDRIYVGTIGGGILRSTNGGASFAPVNEGVPFSRVSSLAGDPGDPDVVVAGLELLDAQSALDWQGVVLRTVNGGANWTTQLSGVGRVPRVALCPSDPDLLYAAVLIGGVARSLDGGVSWSIVGLAGEWVTDVALAPSDCDTVYAATESGGVYRSTSAGTAFAGPFTQGFDVQKLGDAHQSVDPLDADRVLAANHSGVFLSEDGAAAWTRVPEINAGIVRSLGVSPAAPELVWLSTWGQGAWTRAGSAAEWQHVPASALPRDWSLTSAPDPLDADRVVVGAWADLWASHDAGASFASASGPLNVFSVAYHPSDAQVLYVGTQVGGVWRSGDGGASYVEVNDGLPAPWATGPCVCRDVRAVVIDRATPTTIYAATNLQGVFRSENEGGSWEPGAASLAGESISCLVQDDAGDLFACVAGEGIWKSSDGAATFAKITGGAAELNNAGSLYIDPSNGDMYAASDSGVFRSQDAGASWNGIDNLCLPGIGITTPVILDDGDRRLLVGTGGVGVYALKL